MIAVVVSNKTKGFFTDLADDKCSDDATNEILTDFAEQVREFVFSKNVKALIVFGLMMLVELLKLIYMKTCGNKENKKEREKEKKKKDHNKQQYNDNSVNTNLNPQMNQNGQFNPNMNNGQNFNQAPPRPVDSSDDEENGMPPHPGNMNGQQNFNGMPPNPGFNNGYNGQQQGFPQQGGFNGQQQGFPQQGGFNGQQQGFPQQPNYAQGNYEMQNLNSNRSKHSDSS